MNEPLSPSLVNDIARDANPMRSIQGANSLERIGSRLGLGLGVLAVLVVLKASILATVILSTLFFRTCLYKSVLSSQPRLVVVHLTTVLRDRLQRSL